ncbi:undecaprenyldiphospho-muramoylpentapeptide beta-N-acetylglucosaminyltransferase [Candidatus Saganbacteria bacterium CG08_land_8_20_14_0_20_45_16]|uniref:UDP-N-acetylglucosamine--N-acetylmuramyl-(pentapeptide) pyrophosphoryl-undecaprenol N-acetylglucosamine transferase n=1 Tax=Candidatus Saganbacteria bacterium CG08_land_8_20_14_0_20_45_16 TaxID=2014293 RepID=A0A2H0XTL8_UNCSA|nr:MAG: undecaprenyldiphospho-muramoylpentapeptide beta-N-acetylglucosaminyltransferase [Candidatus Saganbacteria bacterium CG08_land_8_20_14_0_20_45_16]
MKTAIVAGGTGGHIYPGIAIAQELTRRGKNGAILFIGGWEGLEKILVPKAGFVIKLIWARAMLRKLSYQALSAPFVSLVGFFQSIFLLLMEKPDILIATGGYVSLPVCLAAKLLRVPIILLEQNVLPGFVTRLCARLATKIFLAFEESQKYLVGEVVGNPVRRAIIELKKQPHEPTVLVIGGSQGARTINQSVISSIDKIPQAIKVIHVIGQRDYSPGHQKENYLPLAYVDNMAELLAKVDLVVSRSGATALAEFLVVGLPMVLIPFPYAAGNHQWQNAQVLAKAGCAKVIANQDFTPQVFIKLLTDFDSQQYAKMSTACQLLARPLAAERIVDFIYDYV